jgi:hypothetical protein
LKNWAEWIIDPKTGEKLMWKTEYRCVECDHIITFNEKMGYLGCCPYCGVVSVGTILATTKTSYKIERIPKRMKWWHFWDKKYVERKVYYKPELGPLRKFND